MTGRTGRVYAGGNFDLIHPGHVLFLEAAAKLGCLTVALNTDEFSIRYKRKPIQTLSERLTVVSALRCVDSVIVNWGCEDSKPSIQAVRPDIIVHGDDWTGPELFAQMGFDQAWLDEKGIKMVYLPLATGMSTSKLIDRCLTN